MALISNALTSIETVKSHLAISATDTSQNSRLELLINAASQRLDTMCNRALKERQHIEYRSGRRSNILTLREWPITLVTELNVDSSSQFGPTTVIDNSLYTVGDDNNSIILLGEYFASGFHNIKVSYTAGYNATLHPGHMAELELACLWLIEWFYKHRERGDMGRTSKSKGDESVGILAQMPPMIREIVQDHQRLEIPMVDRPVGNL